jgi:2'-hydroxyisoflavone reductase
MGISRRKLVQASLAAGAAGALAPGASAKGFMQGDFTPLRVLILGGTGFIGPHMVREALRRGHKVTLFNRGKTNDALFPDVTTLTGDRNNGLDALKGKTWDVVIDNSGYVPRHVEDSARLLADAAEHYVYISTVSVYAGGIPAIDEDSPLATIADETVEEVTGETYGALKALCEQRAATAFGADRLTILRPTYICGPGDHTDRFTYWPARASRGGDMLWPGTPADKIQIIDVRDLANFTLDTVDKQIVGTFNTVTPAGQYTMGDLLDDCRAVTTSEFNPVWVPYEFQLTQDLGSGNVLPIWSPPLPEYAGFAMTSGERAVAAGLRNRNTRETARDALAWWNALPAQRKTNAKAGLLPAAEATVLANWAASSAS